MRGAPPPTRRELGTRSLSALAALLSAELLPAAPPLLPRPLPAAAATVGGEGAAWRLQLPEGWAVRRKLDTFSGTHAEVVLLAARAETGAEARLTCVPLDAGVRAAPARAELGGPLLDARAQTELAGALLSRPPTASARDAVDAVGRALQAQVASPASRLLSVTIGAVEADELRNARRADGGGGGGGGGLQLGATRRYVSFGYEASACPPAAWVDGACDAGGRDLRRRHACALTAGRLPLGLSAAQRSGGARPGGALPTALGRDALLDGGGAYEPRGAGGLEADVLWLLDVSAPLGGPAAAQQQAGAVWAELELVRASFDVL